MGKMFKGVVKFTVAAAAVAGVCYAFKDKIKGSRFYQEYDVDTKLDKVKNTIKEKVSILEDEDVFDDDELIFDDLDAEDPEKTYVSINPENTGDAVTEAADSTDSETTADEASEA